MRKAYITLISLLILSNLYTQEAQLDTIEVSSLQIPLQLNQTGRNITVINRSQIAALAANSLDEVLETLPGIEVQSRGGFGVQGDILMRGSTFTQVLVLIDGMKLNDPLTGHFNSNLPITKAEIERIEILRGAGSAMYGADAVGGVINIITKVFANKDYQNQTTGGIGYGQNKLIAANQGFYLNLTKTQLSGGFNLNHSDGEFIEQRNLSNESSLEAYNNFFDIKTFGLSVGHSLSNQIKLRFRGGYDYRDFNARYFYTTSPFDKSVETVKNYIGHFQMEHKGTTASTQLNLAYKNGNDVFVFSPDFPSTNTHTTEFLNFTLHHLKKLNENLTLGFGGQADQRKIESNDRGNHDDFHAGVYSTAAYSKSRLNLNLSLRADYDANYNFEFMPQANFSYIFNSLVLRGSVGRFIRAADYTERYVSNNLVSLTPGRSLGNPDLLTERGYSEEIGLDFWLTDNIKFKSSVFLRQANNLIDYVSTNESEIGSVSAIGSLQENEDYFFARNISSVNTRGIEFETELNFPVKEKHALRFNLGYTYLNTTNSDGTVSVYLSNHAKHLLNANLITSIDKFSFTLGSLYKNRPNRLAESIGRELTESYLICNFKSQYQVTKNFGVKVQVRNIFDEQYQNILGADMPGRWLLAGINWSFRKNLLSF